MNSIVSKTSATESIRSSVSNLNSICDGIQCDEICNRYYAKHGMPSNKVSFHIFCIIVIVAALCAF